MGLTVGSLFAGIGGMDLGLERAGMEIKWQVEIDDYCNKVLAKHWPDVKRYRDVREVGKHNLEPVDLICGGFPCQDISNAGKRAGIDGERSGLWSEFARIICELRPRYVLVENVAALLGRGIERVLGDLAESGYDAEWDCIPAAAVGAPHRRDRVWIVAFSRCWEQSQQRNAESLHYRRSSTSRSTGTISRSGCDGRTGHVANPNLRCNGESRQAVAADSCATDVANPNNPRLEGRISRELPQCAGEWAAGQGGASVADANGGRCEQCDPSQWSVSEPNSFGNDANTTSNVGREPQTRNGRQVFTGGSPLAGWTDQWATEPNVGRVANGIPARVDRLKGLGNAVVPQVAEWIGRRIMEVAGYDAT